MSAFRLVGAGVLLKLNFKAGNSFRKMLAARRRHEFGPQNLCEGQAWQQAPIIPTVGRQTWEDPCGLLTGQFSHIIKLWAKSDTVSENKEREIEENSDTKLSIHTKYTF